MLSEQAAQTTVAEWGSRMLRARTANRWELTTRREVAELLPAHEWVRFAPVSATARWFNHAADDLTAIHEILAVWSAVAKCPGYGFAENLRFWSRMLNWWRPQTCLVAFPGSFPSASENRGLKVTLALNGGAVTMNNSSEPDPLIGIQQAISQLCTFNSDPSSQSAEYQAAIARLSSFMDLERDRSDHSVGILLELRLANESIYTEPYRGFLQLVQSAASDLSRALSIQPSASVGQLHFSFDGLWLPDLCIKTTTQLAALTNLIEMLPEKIKMHDIVADVDSGVTAAAFAQFVTSTLQTRALPDAVDWGSKPRGRGVKSLTLCERNLDSHRLASFFSALPYSRSLEMLCLQGTSADDVWLLSKLEFSWLAYAIFHPETTNSRWHHLVMKHCNSTRSFTRELRKLKENPAAFLSASRLARAMDVQGDKDVNEQQRQQECHDPHTLSLQLARVKTGCVVYEIPCDSASPMTSIRDDRQLEICDFKQGEWRCVLVPAVGFGWICESDLVEVDTWVLDVPPTSTIDTLEQHGRYTMTKTLQLLDAIGERVVALRVNKLNTATNLLDSLAVVCPNLRWLSVTNTSRRLSQFSLERYFDRRQCKLESLTIDSGSSHVGALISILTHYTEYLGAISLNRLHIKLNAWLWHQEVRALVDMLRANTHICELHLSNLFELNSNADFTDLEAFNHEDAMSIQDQRRRLALLSVFSHANSEDGRRFGAFYRLDAVLVAIILRFATGRKLLVVRFTS